MKRKLISSFLALVMLITALPLMPVSSYAAASGEAVCLSSLEVINWDRYTGNEGDSRIFILGESNERNGNTGINGEIFQNGIDAWLARWNYTNEISWVKYTYRLSAHYSHLTGRISLIKDTKGNAGYNYTNFDTTVYFYNGETLLKSYRLTNTDYNKTISVNVEGVQELTILVKDNKAVSGGTSFALYDLFLDGSSPSYSDVKEFNGHYYKCYDESMTWTQAKEYCESLGGHLATVTSADEQLTIEQLTSDGIKNAYWLGGFYNDNKWQWVTGESFDIYTNWDEGEPNDYLERGENSLLIEKGKWNDQLPTGDPTGNTIEKIGFVCEWDSYDDFNTNTDGMQIIINNTNLTYYVDDYMYIAVCENKNNVKTLPEKLSVKISDTSVIKADGIYDYNDLPDKLKDIEEFKKYKLIMFKALSVGSAMISITNNETGENRIIPISVCKDEVAELRADNVPTKTYKCGFETDYYNGYSDGIWISDFACEKASDNSGWNISMNLYNENYCCGVVEVYNADGKLIEVRDVGKFESLTKGILKTFKAGYTVVEDFVQGDAFSFRSDSTSKHTKIENLYVPQDGHIRVTADISASSVCAVNNGFDVIFTAISLADDITGIIKGINSLSEENMKQIKKAAFAKLLAQEEYLKFAEKFQEKMIKKAKENIAPDIINEFTRIGILDLEELLNDMGWSLDGLLKTALGTGTGIAEGLFEKCAGPFGLTLRGMFLIQDVCDFICEVNDLGKRITGNAKFGCYTPVAGSTSGVIKNEHVTVDTKDKVPSETVLQSFRIIDSDSTVVVLNESYAYSDYQLYEIALYCNGVTIQPDGKVKVYIDCPYEKAIVARENEDGTLEYIESEIENGMVVFEVDHFCKFTVINEESEVKNYFGDVSMHRLYNPNSGEHFYTSNTSEKDNLVKLGWKYEGIGWNAPETSSTPVYRLYNQNGGEHHYTSSESERDFLVSVGWKFEDIGWYSDDAKSVPVYRQYNPNAFANNHNYTPDKSENDWLVGLGWKAEGIGWYGVA